jgi:hypothetical protein
MPLGYEAIKAWAKRKELQKRKKQIFFVVVAAVIVYVVVMNVGSN